MNTMIKRLAIPVIGLLLLGWMMVEPESPPINEHLVMSVLWYQTSAEMRALCYQTFHLARLQLEKDSRTWNRQKGKPRAVIVDIDDTILDNSPHSAKLILEDKSYPYAWTEWVNRAKAEALPGAAQFLTYARENGYEVFYVSNRSASSELDGTIRNLRDQGLPQADSNHVLLRITESSKEARRKAVQRTHDVVLLLGDNLNDHASVFEQKTTEERFRETDRLQKEFGERFIVLPNPMYGEWESATYKYQRGLSEQEKSRLRRSALRGF